MNEGFTMLLADLRDMNGNYRSPIGVYKLQERLYNMTRFNKENFEWDGMYSDVRRSSQYNGLSDYG